MMRLLLTIFLGAAAGLQLAHALQCHVCSHPNNCMQPMRCPALVTHCMTTRTYQTPTRILVSKSCVPKCYPTVEDIYTKIFILPELKAKGVHATGGTSSNAQDPRVHVRYYHTWSNTITPSHMTHAHLMKLVLAVLLAAAFGGHWGGSVEMDPGKQLWPSWEGFLEGSVGPPGYRWVRLFGQERFPYLVVSPSPATNLPSLRFRQPKGQGWKPRQILSCSCRSAEKMSGAYTCGLHLAHALKCHQCKDFYDCRGPVICPPFSTHCLTASSKSMGRTLISKMCYTNCPNTKASGFGDYASIACCQADLCNHGGVAHVEVSYVTLVLGLSFSLICTLLLRTGL
ncbi:uncharacterized protein LOC100082309 [Ornithorhynchus anatinus]|uniref:uncharacterized protein LOC100082309 n=1 Tax=Ornithorhynchus anatinus TaxID=9258 RepID=UPI0019D43CA7|nr:uncharacterized protein LOC100082309 [Ornithorhynchus anatinus]